MERVVLYCDMNNYFASAEGKYDPMPQKVPFAVRGDPEMRFYIFMIKNSLAKRAGTVDRLISYQQAKEIYPDHGFVKANMPRYPEEIKNAKKTCLKYSDTVIPYEMDESWVGLTDTGVIIDQGRQITCLICLEIMCMQELSASVGISGNLEFPKPGIDYEKPFTTTVIVKLNYRQLVWLLPVSDLLLVSQKRKRVLLKIRIYAIVDIAQADPDVLNKLPGKAGYDIWRFASGGDRNFHPKNDRMGIIGNTITPPEDLSSNEDTGAVIYLIINYIYAGLCRHHMKAYCISISTKDNQFNMLTRQCNASYLTDNIDCIFNQAFALFLRHYSWEQQKLLGSLLSLYRKPPERWQKSTTEYLLTSCGADKTLVDQRDDIGRWSLMYS